jgi:hypothetical protein
MALTTSRLTKRSFDTPDEIRPFEARGHLDVIDMDGAIGRGVFEPGWRWSTDVAPLAGTDSCQAAHAGYIVSGAMHVVMDNGDEADYGPGDLMLCPPGHDAWTIGDEACVFVDWTGATGYAKRS